MLNADSLIFNCCSTWIQIPSQLTTVRLNLIELVTFKYGLDVLITFDYSGQPRWRLKCCSERENRWREVGTTVISTKWHHCLRRRPQQQENHTTQFTKVKGIGYLDWFYLFLVRFWFRLKSMSYIYLYNYIYMLQYIYICYDWMW